MLGTVHSLEIQHEGGSRPAEGSTWTSGSGDASLKVHLEPPTPGHQANLHGQGFLLGRKAEPARFHSISLGKTKPEAMRKCAAQAG